MKKQFFCVAAVGCTLRRVICTAFVLAAGFTMQAQTFQVKQAIGSSAASVKYMGSQQDMLSVAVQYNNAQGRRFTVTVRDQDGYQFFQGSFTERKFDKTFQLPRPGVSKVIFSIQDTGTSEVQSFEINAKDTEEMVVKRVR